MARLPYVAKETATPEQKRVFEELERSFRRVLNMFRLWANSPQTLETFLPFYRDVTAGTLDAKLRELAYIKTSVVNHCEY